MKITVPVVLVMLPRLVQFDKAAEGLVWASISNRRPGWLASVTVNWLPSSCGLSKDDAARCFSQNYRPIGERLP